MTEDERLEKIQYISNRLIDIARMGAFTGSVTIHFKKGDAMNEEDFKNERFFDILKKRKIILE
jgi:hypothetical protein